MRHGNLKAFVVLLVAILLASCATAPAPVPNAPLPTVTPRSTQPPPTVAPRATQPLPTVTKRATWKLTPLALEVAPPSGGWIHYHLTFFLENQGSEWGPVNISTGAGTVQTQEGFTYPVSPMKYLFGDPVPPGFRINPLRLDYSAWVEFKAAEQTYLTKIVFADYETFDLSSVPIVRVSGDTYGWGVTDLQTLRKLGFPTTRPNSDFRNIPDTIEIPNKARIAFKQASRSGEGVEFDVEFKNLNVGNDTSVKVRCNLFDGIGGIHLDYDLWRRRDVLGAGPGQTVQYQIRYFFRDPQDTYSPKIDIAELRSLLTNAKLVCFGDFRAIFNVNVTVQ